MTTPAASAALSELRAVAYTIAGLGGGATITEIVIASSLSRDVVLRRLRGGLVMSPGYTTPYFSHDRKTSTWGLTSTGQAAANEHRHASRAGSTRVREARGKDIREVTAPADDSPARPDPVGGRGYDDHGQGGDATRIGGSRIAAPFRTRAVARTPGRRGPRDMRSIGGQSCVAGCGRPGWVRSRFQSRQPAAC